MAHPIHLVQAIVQAQIPVDDYFRLVALPNGISYDISTQDTERELPQGWNSRRCKWVTCVTISAAHDLSSAATYRQLGIHLRQGEFAPLQKSDWVTVQDEISTIETYVLYHAYAPQHPTPWKITEYGSRTENAPDQ